MKRFESISKGELKKYVGCKCRIKIDRGHIGEGLIYEFNDYISVVSNDECLDGTGYLKEGYKYSRIIYIGQEPDTAIDDTNYKRIEVEENTEFKRGEIVEVSDNNKDWCERIYLTTIEGAVYPYVVVGLDYEKAYKKGEQFMTANWSYIRKLPKTIKISTTDGQVIEIDKEKAKELGFTINE